MSSLAPLEALAKQRLSDLWESTLALLEQGKQEDERGNSAAAYLQYSEAIGGLQALLEQEADARRQELLRARLVEYSLRLQQLNALRQEAQEAAAPAFPSAPSQAPPVQQQLSGGLTSGGLTIQASSAASPAAKPLASARLATEQAVQADEAGDSTEALELYTIAIEAFFEAITLEPAAEHRTLMAGLLDRAEQLKLSAAATGVVAATRPATAPAAAAAPAAASPPAAARPAAPPAGQGYTEEEKAVLTRSSTINGRRYYPWLDDAARERFSYAAAWSDPDGLLALNAEQRSHFGRWARPSEVMRGAHPAPRTLALSVTPYPIGSARLVANRHTLALAPTLALTIALAITLTLTLTLALGRRAQDDLPGLVAHDHTDDHHRLLIRLISRHRRSVRTQVPQAADHQDPLPAGALTLHCMHTACALHSCTCTASHGRDPPARRTGAVCPSTTRQASTS